MQNPLISPLTLSAHDCIHPLILIKPAASAHLSQFTPWSTKYSFFKLYKKNNLKENHVLLRALRQNVSPWLMFKELKNMRSALTGFDGNKQVTSEGWCEKPKDYNNSHPHTVAHSYMNKHKTHTYMCPVQVKLIHSGKPCRHGQQWTVLLRHSDDNNLIIMTYRCSSFVFLTLLWIKQIHNVCHSFIITRLSFCSVWVYPGNIVFKTGICPI